MKKRFTQVYILNIILVVLVNSASAGESSLTLRLQSFSTGFLDDAKLYFNYNASAAFVSPEDERKTHSLVEGIPSLYSFSSEGYACFENGYGNLMTTQIVPLGTMVDFDGNYSFSALTMSGFDPTCIIRLEDRLSGNFTDLRTGSYTTLIRNRDNDTGRFYIHITHPAVFTHQNSGCLNNEGSITVTIDPTAPWDICQLYDTANNLLATITGVNSVANFTGLAEGNYYVAFLIGQYSSGKYFSLGGNYITNSISYSGLPIYVGQPVVFHGAATNANNYEWDFGDGTIITGVMNPSMTYYAPGNYSINLKCTNTYGCSASTQMNVTVEMPSSLKDDKNESIGVTTDGKTIRLNKSGSISETANVHIYNLIGKRVFSSNWYTEKYTIDLNEQPSGYYIVSIKKGNETDTRRVYLE